jgi:hypothetical protein
MAHITTQPGTPTGASRINHQDRMAAIHKKGRERLEELREQHRAESERLLGVFGDVLSVVRDATTPPEAGTGSPQALPIGGPAGAETEPVTVVAERAGRMVLKTLADAGGVVGLSTAYEALAAHHGNNYLPLLEPFYRSHRAALFTFGGHPGFGGHHRGPRRVGRGGVHPHHPAPARRLDTRTGHHRP